MQRSPIERDVCERERERERERRPWLTGAVEPWRRGGSYPNFLYVMIFIICILSHKLLGLNQCRSNSPILSDFAIEVCKHFSLLAFLILVLLNLILILMLNEDYIL
jgi:hypothetical protein